MLSKLYRITRKPALKHSHEARMPIIMEIKIDRVQQISALETLDWIVTYSSSGDLNLNCSFI